MLAEEEELYWKYSIPTTATFKVKYTENCAICNDNVEFIEWLSKFLVANIPNDILQNAIKIKFNIVVDSDTLQYHKLHILTEYKTKEEIRQKAIEDFESIESDLPRISNEKKAMETAIRMLYAKILEMEQRNNTGREFLMSIHELKGLIEMKLKLTNELPADDVRLNLADIIKMGDNKMRVTKKKEDDEDYADDESGEEVILPEIKK